MIWADLLHLGVNNVWGSSYDFVCGRHAHKNLEQVVVCAFARFSPDCVAMVLAGDAPQELAVIANAVGFDGVPADGPTKEVIGES